MNDSKPEPQLDTPAAESGATMDSAVEKTPGEVKEVDAWLYGVPQVLALLASRSEGGDRESMSDSARKAGTSWLRVRSSESIQWTNIGSEGSGCLSPSNTFLEAMITSSRQAEVTLVRLTLVASRKRVEVGRRRLKESAFACSANSAPEPLASCFP